MPTHTDVAIVGGGIAGASLAYALAREGLGVTVLEATTEYADRVRGESMQCWGVVEARELGVEQVLLDAGAHISATWNQYTQGSQEPAPIPMNMLVPGVGGTLNLRHPDACQALIDAAAGAGATVVRGASHIELGDGDTQTVRFDVDGASVELRAQLVGRRGRPELDRAQAGGDHARATGADLVHLGAVARRSRRRARRLRRAVRRGRPLLLGVPPRRRPRSVLHLQRALEPAPLLGPRGHEALPRGRARSTATPGAPRSRPRHPPDRARPTPATTRGHPSRSSTASC